MTQTTQLKLNTKICNENQTAGMLNLSGGLNTHLHNSMRKFLKCECVIPLQYIKKVHKLVFIRKITKNQLYS